MIDFLSLLNTAATFVVDVSQVEANLRSFPDGPVEATVKKVTPDVSKKGGTMLSLELEIYHPSVGSATIKDWLPASFPAKVKAFWMAVNDMTEEEIANDPLLKIEPEGLIDATLILQIGDQENKGDGKVYKQVVAPWYYPISRHDLLSTDGAPV